MTVTVEYEYEIPYARLRSGGPSRPLIDVTLSHGDAELDVLAIVDSGADFSIFHADYARLLGLSLASDQ